MCSYNLVSKGKGKNNKKNGFLYNFSDILHT